MGLVTLPLISFHPILVSSPCLSYRKAPVGGLGLGAFHESPSLFNFFFNFNYLFLERGEEREKEKERNING